MEEGEVRKIWKEYFEDIYDIDTQEQVAYLGSVVLREVIIFEGEPIKRTKVEVRVGKLKTGRLQVRMRSLEIW